MKTTSETAPYSRAITWALAIGLVAWFLLGGESETERLERQAFEQRLLATLAALPPEQRYPEVTRKILGADAGSIILAEDDLKIVLQISDLVDEREIYHKLTDSIPKLIKGARQYKLDLTQKKIHVSVSANAVDKFGNPSSSAIAVTAIWDGSDLQKVSDENAPLYGLDLAKRVYVPQVGRSAAINFCKEWNTFYSKFCRLVGAQI